MNEWFPIETAPKDGTEVLVWRDDCGVLLARWIAPYDFLTESELERMGSKDLDEPDWFCADFIAGFRNNDGPFTHCMPLPNPPNEMPEL